MDETPQQDRRDLLKKAVQALDEMQAKVRALERARAEPIAIVGLGCRFPGNADSADAFWRLLRDGVDAVREVPPERWSRDRYFELDPDFAAKLPPLRGGFLDRVDEFDPAFFGISPREAACMDPQQRLVLEVSWQALEHAGYDPTSLRGSQTGVFVGVTASDYWGHVRSADPTHLDVYIATGNTHNAVAGRVSFTLGLQGPSMAVDTACSSSLVAVHLACQSLRLGESDLALAGGVNTMHNPDAFFAFFKWGMTALDGRCKTFDESADGFVRSEGCGIVALKRLSDAEADGDRILAVIRGSAVNQDGATSGFTVPNGFAQESLIRQALRAGGVEPSAVGYVEAHGTGTSLGDPIELEALDVVLGDGRSSDRRLIVGSVKTNLGHLESAAGVAGLIKVVLALEHGEIPRHLHFNRLNGRTSFRGLPPIVPVDAMPWAAGETRRIAGVSSFGISGTNAHVVVEEAPARATTRADVERPLHVITLSAKNDGALQESIAGWRDHLAAHHATSLADSALTANVGRPRHSHRVALVSSSVEQATNQLAALAGGELPAGAVRHQLGPDDRLKIAFLFSGQGAQYEGMARELYDTAPTFRRTLDRCDELLRPHLDRSLLSVLYPTDDADRGLIDQTAHAQPALFAVEYALAELWRSWGIEPALVLGHSVGEYVAACVAGVFSLEDGLRLIAARGRLMQALPPGGAMAAVLTGEAKVRAAIAKNGSEQLTIAAINGPASVTISGRAADLASACAAFERDGIRTERLRVSHAFHSALVEPMLDAFEEVARTVRFSPPRIAVATNVTGRRAADDELVTPAYWRKQIRETVRFQAGVETLHQQGCTATVEIGPSPVLLGAAQTCVASESAVWLPSLRRDRGAWETMLTALATLHVRGAPVQWRAFDAPYARRKVAVPTYPFQRQRFWIDAKPRAVSDRPAADAWREWLYEVDWQTAEKSRERGQSAASAASSATGRWLVFADAGGVGERLAQAVSSRGGVPIIVVKGESFRTLGNDRLAIDPRVPDDYRRVVRSAIGPDRPCLGVVHCWTLDESLDVESAGSTIELAEERACGSVLHIVQALASAGLEAMPHVTLVTRGAQPVDAEDSVNPMASMVWGLGRTVAREQSELGCVCVDLDPTGQRLDGELAALADVVLSGDRGENQIAFRRGGSFVPRFRRSPSSSAYRAPLQLVGSDAAYLITGGLKGIGLLVARWLATAGARRIVLLARSDPGESARRAIAAMEEQGTTVTVVKADVADREALGSIFDRLDADGTPLRGVVHSAGVVDDGVLIHQTWDRFDTAMSAKVRGAWNLHALTASRSLDFFVLFSSTASLVGPPGQGNYAAANAFLDALAHHRRRRGLAGLSVNWGPWAEVGLAARGNVLDRAKAIGVGAIDSASGVRALEHLLQVDVAQTCVLPVDWNRFLATFPAGRELPLFRDMTGPAPSTVVERTTVSFVEELDRAPRHLRWPMLLDHVTEHARRVLGLDRSTPVDPKQGLRDLGLDSMMAVELRNRLQASVGRALRSTLAFDYPSIDAITRHLFNDVLALEASGTAQTADTGGDADDLLFNIEQLSDDEAEQMFATKVNDSRAGR